MHSLCCVLCATDLHLTLTATGTALTLADTTDTDIYIGHNIDPSACDINA